MSAVVAARMKYNAHVYNHFGCRRHHCDRAKMLWAIYATLAGFR